jgi:glyoxylase-like metal-dependent hydrolase (beta-lactamase superfamily II)
MATDTTIGSAKVTAVLDSEGPFFLPLIGAFPSLDDETIRLADVIDPRPETTDPDVWWLAFRVYVVQVAGRVIVVDTGASSDTDLRPFWAPVGPHLTQRLHDELGLAASDVTDVVLTHLHRDHAAGTIDSHGRPAFPGATYHLQARELETVACADSGELWEPLLLPLFAADQLRLWAGGAELASVHHTAVRLEWTPGHTPGHQSLAISSAADLLVLAGDAFVHAVQLVDPFTRYVFDAEEETAGQTRSLLLERLRATAGRLGTAHLGAPFTVIAAHSDSPGSGATSG